MNWMGKLRLPEPNPAAAFNQMDFSADGSTITAKRKDGPDTVYVLKEFFDTGLVADIQNHTIAMLAAAVIELNGRLEALEGKQQ